MKNLTIIDAINELIKGVNTGFARQAYSMQEVRDIYNAIEFITEAAKTQQAVNTELKKDEKID